MAAAPAALLAVCCPACAGALCFATHMHTIASGHPNAQTHNNNHSATHQHIERHDQRCNCHLPPAGQPASSAPKYRAMMSFLDRKGAPPLATCMDPERGYRGLREGVFRGLPAILTPAKGDVWVQVRPSLRLGQPCVQCPRLRTKPVARPVGPL